MSREVEQNHALCRKIDVTHGHRVYERRQSQQDKHLRISPMWNIGRKMKEDWEGQDDREGEGEWLTG